MQRDQPHHFFEQFMHCLHVIRADCCIGENNRRGYAKRQIEKHLDSPEQHTHTRTTSVLDAGLLTRDTTGITIPQRAICEIRFGARSDFGFEKPCRFFDLRIPTGI
jgi:hypothetical protein